MKSNFPGTLIIKMPGKYISSAKQSLLFNNKGIAYHFIAGYDPDKIQSCIKSGNIYPVDPAFQQSSLYHFSRYINQFIT